MSTMTQAARLTTARVSAKNAQTVSTGVLPDVALKSMVGARLSTALHQANPSSAKQDRSSVQLEASPHLRH
jgi:hypothetical protein